MSPAVTRLVSPRPRLALCLATAALSLRCDPPSPELARAAQPVVYGTDDRTDVYAHPDSNLRALAQQSIVALMRPTAIDATNPSNVTFTAGTLGVDYNLCAGQRFADNPTAAHCSGTLIDDDLVLTAGHCIADMADCANTRFVFNYYYSAAGTLQTVTTADVFTCTAIEARALTNTGGVRQDYAILRMDRRATPRFTAAPVTRGATTVAMDQHLTVIGFGSGIPAKIDSGGQVTDLRAGATDYFTANTDTFQGNSGSGVFDTATRSLVGILVRGATDYVPMGACQIAHTCANVPGAATCEGEAVNYPQPALDDFCRTHTSARLCPSASDGGAEAAVDAAAEAAVDAAAEAAVDAAAEASADANTEAATDSGSTPDASAEAATDSGTAGMDGAADAASPADAASSADGAREAGSADSGPPMGSLCGAGGWTARGGAPARSPWGLFGLAALLVARRRRSRAT